MSEIKKEKFTPGPWRWVGNDHCYDLKLATVHSGRRYVMGFKRWGLQGAQPTFQPKRSLEPSSKMFKFEVGNKSVTGSDEAKKDTSVYRHNIRSIDTPDAHLIVAAPCLYEAVKLAQSRMEPGSDLYKKMEDVMSKARGETSILLGRDG